MYHTILNITADFRAIGKILPTLPERKRQGTTPRGNSFVNTIATRLPLQPS